jgi:uncharacterized protein (AIM24 family)
VTTTYERIECQWCRAQNPVGQTSCQTCGAPLDTANLVTDSGWREAPRLRDMTEIAFGQGSTCQVEGEIVPVAELNLSAQDGVYFEHHVMLWKDSNVPVSVMNTQGGAKRAFSGMPYVVTMATGPGRIAFSRDAAGELVVLPIPPSTEIDVRGHAFLVASHLVGYSFVPVQGFVNILHGGQGMYMDRFVTTQWPGLLILHGYGNVFERYLQAGESLMVEPGAFLYKDAAVTMNVEQQDVKTGILGRRGMYLTRLTGPGRIAIQSMYHHHGE